MASVGLLHDAIPVGSTDAVPVRLPLGDRPEFATRLYDLRRAVSYRRHLLDAHLTWVKPLMSGSVVDLGGKRDRKRGTFRPPSDSRSQWTYVNIDASTCPDLQCDVSDVPLPDGAADCIVCTEVLEHLPEPDACVREAHRLLRDGGTLLVSVPFLYPVHADPHDFSRFTADGLRRLLRQFSSVRVMSMGGYWGTLGMMLEQGARRQSTTGWISRVQRRLLFESGRLMQWHDARQGAANGFSPGSAHTTGYFVIARK